MAKEFGTNRESIPHAHTRPENISYLLLYVLNIYAKRLWHNKCVQPARALADYAHAEDSTVY